jgi:hypothetical protein
MPMTLPTIPDGLEDALRDFEWAIPTIDAMPLDYRKRAFLFIEQASNELTRNVRISNFVEVVKFFHQDLMP